MDWMVIVSSLSIALGFLTPLAIKWQIKLRYALAGAMIMGGTTGALLSWDLLRGDLSSQMLVPLEFLFILVFTLAATTFFFYRDPERFPPHESGVIVSPADGGVLYIKTIDKGEVPSSQKKGRKFKLKELTKTDLLADGSYLIGIGMNLLNVHVNRAPIRGEVIQLKHIEGNFLSLKQDKAIISNERCTTVISNGEFKIAVVQIASRLVRRIVSYLQEGEVVEPGQRIGMIKFGSQVDLVLPKFEGLKIVVTPGDEVLAGVSVIAEYGQGG